MDKKKLIGIVAAVIFAAVGFFIKFDVRDAVCGGPVIEAPVVK